MTLRSHLGEILHLGHPAQPPESATPRGPHFPDDLRRVLVDDRPPWPDFVHIEPSANPTGSTAIVGKAYADAEAHGGNIVGVLGVTGVPNGIFSLDSLANWDPHELLHALGRVLTRLHQGHFGIRLGRLAWPREVPNPLAGEKGHAHPLGLLLYHLAYTHDPTFHHAVLERAINALTKLLADQETGIAYGHSYGAFILKDAIAQLRDAEARRLILIALGHAYGELGHGWLPFSPHSSPEELTTMLTRVRGALLMRVKGDMLSGIPPIEHPPKHCEIVELNRVTPLEIGLGGHCTVRTRPDVQARLEGFLSRTLAA